MTTIPGHNQMIQQSVPAQEVSQQSQNPRPSPDQAVGIQQREEVLVNSTVLESEESERLKEQKEKQEEQARQQRRAEAEKKRRKKRSEEEMALDFDAPGRILDTTV